jgi:hypothetical protein
MPTPTSPDSGADLTNQFISDRYTSLLHLSGAQMTSPLAEGQTSHGVYDGKGNYTGMGVTTTNISFNNITMPKSTTDTTLVDYFFPIGSIFISLDNVNPGVRMTETVWELVSKGLFLAGVGTGVDRNDESASITAGDTNRGEYTHTLTVEEMPSHKHDVHAKSNRYGRTNGANKDSAGFDATRDLFGDTTYAGGGQAHNNIPPSYGVYVWKRTS